MSPVLLIDYNVSEPAEGNSVHCPDDPSIVGGDTNDGDGGRGDEGRATSGDQWWPIQPKSFNELEEFEEYSDTIPRPIHDPYSLPFGDIQWHSDSIDPTTLLLVTSVLSVSILEAKN